MSQMLQNQIQKRNRVTLKQRDFVTQYLETGNATQAAMQAYKPKKRATARAIGSENLTKPNIQRTIQETLAENGLNADLIIQAVTEDIKNKPGERISELALGAKLLGLLERAKELEQQDIKTLVVPTDVAMRYELRAGEKYVIVVTPRAAIERRGLRTPFDEIKIGRLLNEIGKIDSNVPNQ